MSDRQPCNLVMLYGYGVPRHDMTYVRRLIRQRAPHVRMILSKRQPDMVSWLRSATRRTCMVSFRPVLEPNRRYVRGRLFEGRSIGKAEQNRVMADAELPVPEWALLKPDGERPDVAHLGDYVVTKPDIGGQGADVKIRRVGKVRYRPPKTKMARFLARSSGNMDMLAQRFIYTGPYPSAYRVNTLFGQVLYAMRQEASHERPPLPGPSEFGKAGGGYTIVSSGKGCTFEVCTEPDVIELGQRVHALFPDIPMLGVDIVREQPSGKLYVLEGNPNGFTWRLDRRCGVRIEGEQEVDPRSNFDIYDTVAEVLADVALRHAE